MLLRDLILNCLPHGNLPTKINKYLNYQIWTESFYILLWGLPNYSHPPVPYFDTDFWASLTIFYCIYLRQTKRSRISGGYLYHYHNRISTLVGVGCLLRKNIISRLCAVVLVVTNVTAPAFQFSDVNKCRGWEGFNKWINSTSIKCVSPAPKNETKNRIRTPCEDYLPIIEDEGKFKD